MPPMIALIAAEAALNPGDVVDQLIGVWMPLISFIGVPVLTSFMTKADAEKRVKQFAAVIFTAIFVGLSIFTSGDLDGEITLEFLFARFAFYAILAETGYRTISGSLGQSMNRLSVFKPAVGVGKPVAD